MSTAHLARLISEISSETDVDIAINRIAEAAQDLTPTRHVLVAVLNQQMEDLEIMYGAGDGWAEVAHNRRLPLEIGKNEGLVGWVAATGEGILSGRVQEDPLYRALFSSTQSEIAVPVKDEYGRVRAVLNLESDHRDAYTDADRVVAQGLADLMGSVILRSERIAREEALIQIGSALDDALTEELLIQRVIEVAEKTLRLHSCSIFLIDPQRNAAVLRGTIGELKDQVGSLHYELGEGFTGWVCQHGEPILLDDPQTDPRWRGKYVEIPSPLIASFLAVPIAISGQVFGAIRVLRRKTENSFLDNRFNEQDQRLLQTIAEQVASGLANVRHIERMIRDDRMVAWGELSAKSSHMIGNRVFAVRGDVNELGYMIEDGATTPDELRGIQKSLATNVTRIEEILQDFRDFVTATQLVRHPADVVELVQETAQEIFPRRTSVVLHLDLSPEPIEIPIDSKRLRRAISELIENSLNYIEDGTLRVSCHLRRAGRVVQIEIEDSGPGVPLEKNSLIFQPFYSGRVKGMGLGLSIVKGIVDAHGGEVFEAGIPGSGAKFVILLPVT